MAFYDTTWYLNSVKYAAITARPQNTAVAVGVIRRQFTAPAVGNERAFVCVVAGTTANVTDATWVLTRGAKTTDGTVTWCEITGVPAMNGDATNASTWATAKATGLPSIGAVIKRNNGASYQICTTAGTMAASEPAFSDTAGVTTNDGTSVWTSLGVVGNFSAGGAPFARLATAFSLSVSAGSTVYVGDNHAETQTTTMTISGPTPSISAVSTKVLCHNNSGSYPPASSDITTGASISVPAAVNMTITFSGYIYGVSFQLGAGVSSTVNLTVSTSNQPLVLDNCSLQLLTTVNSTNAQIVFPASVFIVLNNTPVKFGHVSQSFNVANGTNILWQNTAPFFMPGSTTQASVGLFNPNNVGAVASGVIMEGCDLSATTGILLSQQNAYSGNFTFKDCKLSSATLAAPIPVNLSSVNLFLQLIRCDSGTGAYKSGRYCIEGTEVTETAIVRAGGAIDPTGQAQSRKIVTSSANVHWQRPFRAEPYAIWNSTVGANVVVTVYGILDAAAVPNNDDIWMEVEYLGSASSPQGSYATTTKASILAADAAVSSDASGWDNAVTARANSTAYVVGNAIKVASNAGRVFFCTIAGTSAAVEPSAATWNPSDKHANVVLSNGNLTAAASTSAAAGVRSTTSQLGTKSYFEAVWNVAPAQANTWVGLGTSSATLGGLSNWIFFVGFNGNILRNGAVQANLGAVSAGAVVCFALDRVNGMLWVRVGGGNWNGSPTADPATNTEGIAIAAAIAGSIAAYASATSQDVATTTLTVNFGASAFAQVVPSGFMAWNDAANYAAAIDGGLVSDGTAVFRAACRFKLVATLSSPQPGLAGYIHVRPRAAKLGTTYYIDPQINLS